MFGDLTGIPVVYLSYAICFPVWLAGFDTKGEDRVTSTEFSLCKALFGLPKYLTEGFGLEWQIVVFSDWELALLLYSISKKLDLLIRLLLLFISSFTEFEFCLLTDKFSTWKLDKSSLAAFCTDIGKDGVVDGRCGCDADRNMERAFPFSESLSGFWTEISGML